MVNKQEHTTSNAMSQISQVAFFFRGKNCLPDILENASLCF